jgi:WD40 repeat protein
VIVLHATCQNTVPLGAAGHTAAVKGVAIAPSGDLAVSCSTDATVRLWRLPYAPFHAGDVEQADQAVLQFQGAHGFRRGSGFNHCLLCVGPHL